MGVDAAIDLTAEERSTVLELLDQHLPGTAAWVYGSRAQRTSRPQSDLDLVVFATPEQRRQVGDLREAFEESNLPFRVDLFVWDDVPESFRKQIKAERVVLVQDRNRCDGGGWKDLAFSEAVQVNPKVHLERGRTYPFVDMAAVDPNSRCARAPTQRKYSGGGSRFCCGDTLMARITPCLENGKVACYCSEDESEAAYGSTEFIVIRGRQSVTDTAFSYYLTRWSRVRQYAVEQMTGTSGRQRVPTESLDYLRVLIPPLPEQRAIAHVLGTLDDKIELNRRMNETLEAMARALFKSWFVDFDPVRARMEGRDTGLPRHIADLFPDSIDGEGEPEGWVLGTLEDVANCPKRGISPADVAAVTPYIGLEHMPRHSISLTKWGSAGKVTSNKSVFKAGEFLFGKLRPYFHKVGLAPIDGICSTDIVVVVPRSSDWAAFTLACLSSDEFVEYTDQTSTGTKMPRTNWNTMQQFEVCLPSEKVACTFQRMVQPMLETVCRNVYETRILGETRDLLLPKLMSSEIRLGADEIAVDISTKKLP